VERYTYLHGKHCLQVLFVDTVGSSGRETRRDIEFSPYTSEAGSVQSGEGCVHHQTEMIRAGLVATRFSSPDCTRINCDQSWPREQNPIRLWHLMWKTQDFPCHDSRTRPGWEGTGSQSPRSDDLLC